MDTFFSTCTSNTVAWALILHPLVQYCAESCNKIVMSRWAYSVHAKLFLPSKSKNTSTSFIWFVWIAVMNMTKACCDVHTFHSVLILQWLMMYCWSTVWQRWSMAVGWSFQSAWSYLILRCMTFSHGTHRVLRCLMLYWMSSMKSVKRSQQALQRIWRRDCPACHSFQSYGGF